MFVKLTETLYIESKAIEAVIVNADKSLSVCTNNHVYMVNSTDPNYQKVMKFLNDYASSITDI